MVKHIIIWNLKDELSAEEKKERCRLIKQGLEGLAGKIDSTFKSAEALKGYSTHPEHVKVADSTVRPYTARRSCVDFEI